MALLSKEGILGAPDVRFEDVEVPEWGGAVRIKSLSARERDAWEIAAMPDMTGVDLRDKDLLEKMKGRIENVRARLVACTAVGEDGALLFTAEDVAKLGDKNSMVLDRLFQVAQRLNGIGEANTEAITKN